MGEWQADERQGKVLLWKASSGQEVGGGQNRCLSEGPEPRLCGLHDSAYSAIIQMAVAPHCHLEREPRNKGIQELILAVGMASWARAIPQARDRESQW